MKLILGIVLLSVIFIFFSVLMYRDGQCIDYKSKFGGIKNIILNWSVISAILLFAYTISWCFLPENTPYFFWELK